MSDLGADAPATVKRLLGCDDSSCLMVTNPGGAAPVLLIGDHAGRAIPKALGDLGLPPGAIDLHIAWDIGVSGLGRRLAARLDAAFIEQTYSRLVIDCNRKPGAKDCAPAVSDGVPVPGNANLSDDALALRRAEIYAPYQDAIAQALAARAAAPPLLVSLHSFTPRMFGFDRPWRVGVLHAGDSPASHRMLALLQAELGDLAGDNQPYAMDGTDNTVPLHAPWARDYLELEVRQDLIADDAGQDAMADMLARLLAALV